MTLRPLRLQARRVAGSSRLDFRNCEFIDGDECGPLHQCCTAIPPSMLMDWPVIHEPWSLQR